MLGSFAKGAQLCLGRKKILDVKFSIPESLDGFRLDRAVATVADAISRAQAKAAILAGGVEVSGTKVTNPRHLVHAGEKVSASLEETTSTGAVKPNPLELEIVRESPEYLVIDKPPGMVVHPAPGHLEDTLANAVAAHCENAAKLPRAGVVHRLDKDTSGLLVVARNKEARLSLINQFKDNVAKRTYLALVNGSPPRTGTIVRPIGRSRSNRLKMAVVETGRRANTRYETVASTGDYALVRCYLGSGRTHQIRVHFEHAGHPVAGDRLYRSHSRSVGNLFARQMLHAQRLVFNDPATGMPQKFTSPLPDDFAKALEDVGIAADKT